MKINDFLTYFRDYYKGANISIKNIDFSNEIVVDVNDDYEIEVDGYLALNTKNFNGYSVWLYKKEDNILITYW